MTWLEIGLTVLCVYLWIFGGTISIGFLQGESDLERYSAKDYAFILALWPIAIFFTDGED